MVSRQLQENSRLQLLDTLKYFADESELRRYASEVPFVHVPNELACQWGQHSSLLHGQVWFREIFTNMQILELCRFDALLASFLAVFPRDLPDVDELVNHAEWTVVAKAASDLHDVLVKDSPLE